MHVIVVHHDATGSPTTGAAQMARLTVAGLSARGHRVELHESSVGDSSGQPAVVAGRDPRAESVPDVVHVFDLADPQGGRIGRAVADSLECCLVVTPATDFKLWRDPAASLAIARSADVVLVLTEEERDRLEAAGLANDTFMKITQGPLLAGSAGPQEFRQRLGIRDKLVLFLSRRVPSKGWQHLLAAAPAILRRHPDTTVAFAGPAPDGHSADLVAAAGDGRIVDLGLLDEADKHSALWAADLLCVPTVADAFPMVFVEAWWCNTPVVCGPFPGAGEVVREGVDGRIVDATPGAVAVAVNELLDDPENLRRMGMAGRRRAEQALGWDAVVEEVEASYLQALQDRNGAVPGRATPP